MKKLIVLLIITSVSISSCKKDFLEEDPTSIGSTQTFYNTNKGLEYLVTAAYVSNKLWYGKEEGYDFSDAATDVYTYGQQHPNRNQFVFDQTYNAFNSRIAILWVEFNKGLNTCNEALLYLNDPAHPMPAAQKQKRKAEILFLRAHYLWLLTENWGDISLNLTPTTGPVTTATRTPVSAVYKQIVSDLVTSFNLFTNGDNTSDVDFGRINRDAVRAFKARIYLTIASYIKNTGNVWKFTEDPAVYYDSALTYATFFTRQNKLATNYADLWKFETNSTGRNPEGIFAINYSRGVYALLNVNLNEYAGYVVGGQRPFDEREGGHHGHLVFGTQYDFGAGSGMARDLLNGRPFRRYAPTKYLIDAFNENLDARFHGQFKTAWIANSPSAVTSTAYPKWNEVKLPAGFVLPKGDSLKGPVFKRGDTSMVISKRDYPDDRVVSALTTTGVVIVDRAFYLDGRYYVWDYNRLYNADGTINNTLTNQHNWFIPLKKFDDPFRLAADGTGSQNGARDSYLFRHAEMFLIAAEAAHEKNSTGLQYLTTLANARAINKNGVQLLAAYGINAEGDITKERLLDERAREFPGEQLRWFDLKRNFSPADLVTRMQTLNPDTKPNFTVRHYLRPIPQIQLDAISNAAEFGQNPGY